MTDTSGAHVPEVDDTERGRINRLVIDIMTKRGLSGVTANVLLAINDMTNLILKERSEAGAEMANVATDALHEEWIKRIRAHDDFMVDGVADKIIAEVIG